MSQLDFIREQYAQMPDEALLELLMEGDSLTNDAYLALKEECRRRNLGDVKEDELHMPMQHVQVLHDKMKKKQRKYVAGLFNNAIDQKFNHAPDADIIWSLKNKGVSGEMAEAIVSSLRSEVNDRLREAFTERLRSLFFIVCGLAVIVIAIVANIDKKVYWYGILPLVIGLARMAMLSVQASKLKVVVANMEEEAAHAGEAHASDDDSH